MYRTATLWLAVLCAALAAPRAVQAQADGGMAEIAEYRLTEPVMQKYTRAVRSLALLPDADLRALQESGGNGVATLDEAVGVYERHPSVAGAITGAGLRVREFLVFSIALTQAGALGQAPAEVLAGAPPAMRENLAFYRSHEGDLRGLAQELEALGRRPSTPE